MQEATATDVGRLGKADRVHVRSLGTCGTFCQVPHARLAQFPATNVPKGANMPGVKTPAERGIIGAWAYDARLAAELTVSEAVLKLGEMGHRVHEATIRGIESGTKRPGRALLRKL